MPYVVWITYKKGNDFNLETHFDFLDYMKAYDKVKRKNCFEILQSKNNPSLLLN
jgi:hypothetical protein